MRSSPKLGAVKLLIILAVFFFAYSGTVHARNQVLIEFFYWDPSSEQGFCEDCPFWIRLHQEFLSKNETLNDIQSEYGSSILIEWIEYKSEEGQNKTTAYDITQFNSLMINSEVIIEEEFNVTSLREIIDGYLIHDVAVLSVVSSSGEIYIGDTLNINVTVKNEGNYFETFNVTVYYDSNIVETLSVDSLAPNTELTLVSLWDTTGTAEGNYTISARADTLSDENQTKNNVRRGSVVGVRGSQAPRKRHDVAITSVALSQKTVVMGQKTNFTVTAKNMGTEAESFNVSVYGGDMLIDTAAIRELAPGDQVALTFVWDTSNITPGSYFIHVEAEPVTDEVFTEDNIYDYGEVEVAPGESAARVISLLALAFSFGFFETFSPCLLVLLSFILTYTLGEAIHFREGITQVTIFGVGFVVAAVSVGIVAGLIFLSMETFYYTLTWIVSILAILLGLNLLGLLRIPSLETKTFVRKLSRKYAFTYGGLLLLGFLFYFLDPCIAPIFIAMLPLLSLEYMPLIIFVFSLGVFLPFIIVGTFAGSLSMLVRSSYKQRSKIRAASGLFLIAYSVYLIFSYLM